LNEAQIAALVTFTQKELTDSAAFINSDKTVKGDPARGKVKFENTCAACHGLDGKRSTLAMMPSRNIWARLL
jgi:mono/diheme cytochrome c family protein